MPCASCAQISIITILALKDLEKGVGLITITSPCIGEEEFHTEVPHPKARHTVDEDHRGEDARALDRFWSLIRQKREGEEYDVECLQR